MLRSIIFIISLFYLLNNPVKLVPTGDLDSLIQDIFTNTTTSKPNESLNNMITNNENNSPNRINEQHQVSSYFEYYMFEKRICTSMISRHYTLRNLFNETIYKKISQDKNFFIIF